jgi:carboxymethylenebutenolidase
LPATQVDRRGFIVTALGAGFALQSSPPPRKARSRPSTDGLTAGEVKVAVKDGEMVAYRAMPAGKTGAPVVLVVSEIFGVHEYIADVCRRLAKEGYLAIAPELFARYGDPRKMTNIQEILAGVVSKVPDAGRDVRP